MLAFFRNAKWSLLLLSIITIGATQYEILLWLPMYLEEKDFEEFSGLISICYAFFTILSVTTCSKVYGLTSSRAHHFLTHLVILAVGILAMMLVYNLNLKPEDKWLMLLLIGVVGFCIGGLYEMVTSEEVVVLGEREGANLPFVSNFIYAWMYTCIGLTQLVIGAISERGRFEVM